MAKGDRSRAWGEGIVHVADVRLDGLKQGFEAAGQVDGNGRNAGSRSAGHRQALPNRDDGRPVLLVANALAAPLAEERVRTGAGSFSQTSGLPYPATPARRRRDDHSVPALGKSQRYRLDELVDLVPVPPGMGANLGDRQAVLGHRLSL